MNNQKSKRKIPNTKNNKGITLIALIITIIVLLILAVVAIGAVQNDGIINHAKNARDEYGKAQGNESTTLQSYLDKIKENVPTGTGTSSGTVNLKTESKAPLVDKQGNDAKNKVLSTTENTEVVDEYGNKIVVPAGFKIRIDESTGYADHVTEGIVIEDCTETATKGSQFVWIPTPNDGKVYTNTEKTEYKTINLDRYIFASDGTPTPKGDAAIDSYYQELATSTYGNATAKDLQGFINSATTKGGYYLGRYEAGDGVTSSARTDSTSDTNTMVCKAGQYVYNWVTQTQASNLSQNMYTSSKFTSDLVNSYAWDTAIVFIQTFSNDSNYANSNHSTSFANTGVNPDKYCNIHDMSGNAFEWTTETSSDANGPCVGRGGGYYADDGIPNDYTSCRVNFSATSSYSSYSFRPLLYVAL